MSSHHPQEVLLAQFSMYVHKSGLKPDSFFFIIYCDPQFHEGKNLLTFVYFETKRFQTLVF